MSYTTIARLAVPALYLMIALFWFWLAAKIPQLLPQTPLKSERIQRISVLATLMALAFVLDASYWLSANLSLYGFLKDGGSLDASLRAPWKVLLIKFPLLVSVLAFYLVLKSSSVALASEAETTYFSRFVEYTWDAVCITDAKGNVRQWNQGAVNLFGFTRSAVISKNLKDFLVPANLHSETDLLWEEVASSRRARVDYHSLRHTSNGDLIPVDISISPIFDGPLLKGFFGIMRRAHGTSRSRYFRQLQTRRYSEPYAFIAMPFAEEIVKRDVWRLAIYDAVSGAGLRPIRSDTETLTGQIVDQIYDDIRNAKVVIADLTGANPNVFYELGIAQAMDKPVIQIIEKGSRIPFDVHGIRTIEYEPDNLLMLRERLSEAVQRQLTSN